MYVQHAESRWINLIIDFHERRNVQDKPPLQYIFFGVDENLRMPACYVDDMGVGIDLYGEFPGLLFIICGAETHKLKFMICQYFVTHNAFIPCNSANACDIHSFK